MDFITYLNDNDHKVFAALCHLYARQIENAMAKQVDDERDYGATCKEAPRTRLKLHVPHNSLAEIVFPINAGGRNFELCGFVEIKGNTTDRPCLSLRGHDYHYRPEHSRLMHGELNQHENRALFQWWDHVQQSEIISRLQAV